MATKLTGMLKLSRIPKNLIYTNADGVKSIWIDIIEKREPDQYGNTHYIQVYDKFEKKNVYLADVKPQEYGTDVQTTSASAPATQENPVDDLPF